jgi:hypothetical protein
MTEKKKKPALRKPDRVYSEVLKNVNLDILQHHIKSGNKSGFNDDLVKYMELLDLVRSMYAKYEVKSFIVNTLMNQPYNLSRYMATQLYYDAINFFYADNKVKQKAWENVYAEHLEKLAYYALETDDLETARKCFMDAAKMRGVGNEERAQVPKEMHQKPIIIYTVDPRKVGIQPANKNELAKFIDEIPEISERERVRLQREAGITDVTLFEEIKNEDEKDSDN